MKKNVFILVFIVLSKTTTVYAQNFDDFAKIFPIIKNSADSLHLIPPHDTVNLKTLNYFIWDIQKPDVGKVLHPKVFENNKLIDETDFGRYPVSGLEYESIDGKEKTFFAKGFIIGQLQIDSRYKFLVIKIIGAETSYVELFSFTKEGALLSGVLLYEYYHNMFEDPVNKAVTTKSSFSSKTINWVKTFRGLTIKRQYKIRDDGYLEITSNKTEGKFEY